MVSILDKQEDGLINFFRPIRKVLSLKVSNQMSGEICFEAVEEAVRKYGVPKVLHSDRGTQFTSRKIRVYLEELGD
jgi:putative transposase